MSLSAVLALVTTFAMPVHAQGYIFNQMSGSHGTYSSGVAIQTSYAIAQGDFNRDGRLDFAVLDQYQYTCNSVPCLYVDIYLAQSDGSYILANGYPVPGDGYWYSGIAVSSITVGDVNRDGKLDIVYTNNFEPLNGNPNYIAVQLGKGDGTFQAPVMTVSPTVSPSSIVLGDFNGDGKLDAAIADSNASNVYVQLGNGDGTFGQGTVFALQSGGGASQVITADFNRDGKLDLAVASLYGAQDTSVLLGNGDGTFGQPTVYQLGGASVASADINKDGKPDLILSGSSNISVLLGNGDGTFQTAITTAAPGNMGSNIVVADFNGDGKPDVAMPDGWTGIAILLGYGNGTFKSPIYAYGNIEAQWYPALLTGDYNLDGKSDLAAISYVGTGESFSVLTNNGDGTFGVGKDLVAGADPQTVVTGDFNGDGKLDMAVTGYTKGFAKPVVSVYVGNGNGTFAAAKTYATGNNPQGVVTADFRNKGMLDLAVANNGDSTVSILLGNGNGTFAPQVKYNTGSGPNQVAIGDFNRDGNLDLAISDTGDTNVTILLGNGDGSFRTAKLLNTGMANNTGITVADFNRDGNPDIAVAATGNPADQVVLLFGNGDGTFQSPTSLPLPTGATILSVASADLRGNGISDLVALGNGSSPGYYVYLGNGDGTFQPPIPNFANEGTYSIAFADFNGDGKLDVAFAGYNSYAAISLGNGDGTFQPQMVYAVPHTDANINANSVAVGDFNGDGSPDLVATSSNSTDGYLSLILSNPVAAFSSSGLRFGKVAVGSSSTMNLTLTDQSPTKLAMGNITITGGAYLDYTQVNTCGTGIAGYTNCTVTVTFKPSVKGTRNAILNFADSASGPARKIALTGSGIN